MKTHALDHPTPGSPPAYLANGLIGLRVGPIPLLGGTALVNGFCGVSPEINSDEYAAAPYPVGADFYTGDVWLSARPDLAKFRRQEYDFSCGELHSQFDVQAGGYSAHFEVLTFCSRTQPALTLQEITLSVDAPCTLILRSHIETKGLEGRLLLRIMPGQGCDSILHWESRGAMGTLGAASRCALQGDDAAKRYRNNFGNELHRLCTEYEIEAKPGRRYVLRQIGALVPSRLHSEPHWQASRLADVGSWYGFDELREANRAAWAELWKGRPVILGGNASMQEVSDAAYFYLHTSISPSTPNSVAPFGLSRRESYHGHVFWDTETFMFPPVLLTAPRAARAMLDYRSRQIQAARDNAALNGYAGIQFPWQSGATGSEVTVFTCGAQGVTEHHVNMDVAFAFAQYVHATGDDLFLRQQAWPVLEGVAEWIVSRVEKTDRGYEIRHVTGADEFLENVHNNSQTNMAAIVVLREAIGFARRLGFTPPSSWSAVEQGMFLPIDPVTHIMRKHDAYEYKGGMCIPETLAGFFPFTYRPRPEVEQATYRFHLDLASTYVGMPMFSALLGVWAARMGERGLARQFIEKGIVDHLVEPYHQFNESIGRGYSSPAVTVFLTNPAGFLMSLMMGLTGLQLDSGDPQQWGKFPIVMPEGWEGIEVERIWVRGQPMRLRATHGAHGASLEAIK